MVPPQKIKTIQMRPPPNRGSRPERTGYMARFRRYGRFARALCLTTLALVVSQVAHAQQLGIAAVVNDEVISQVDLIARVDFQILASAQTPNADLRHKLAAQTLRGLIDEKLQLQEADEKKITVADDEVMQNLTDIEDQNKMPSGAIFELLDRNHIPHDTLLNQLKARIAWQRVVLRRLRLATSIGDDDIDEALDQMKDSIGKPESLVSEIFLAVDTPEAESEVQKTAQRLVQQARSGGDFAALARQFSDSAAAAVNGDLGWVRQKQLDAPLDAVLTDMQKDQVSDPISTTRGFYILKLVDRRNSIAGDPMQTEVKLSLITLPLPPSAKQSDVASQTDLARMIADTVNGCPDLDRAGKEAGGSGGAIPTHVGEIAPELRDIVLKQPIGKASEPVRTAQGIAVVMVCQRSANDGLPSRDAIRQNLMLQRLDAQSRRYLRDLREAAFIDIRQQ